MKSARDKEVACAFGRGFHEDRCFYLDEAVIVEIVAGYLCHFISEKNVGLKIGASEVEVTVFKTRCFRRLAVGDDLKGGSFALCENAKLGYEKLDVAGGQLVAFCRTLTNRTDGSKHIFASCRRCLFENRSVGILVKCKLQNAGSVPEVDEYQAAEITRSLHPTENGYFFADIGRSEIAAVIGSF